MATYPERLFRALRLFAAGLSIAFLFCFLIVPATRADNWDERLEGTLPLIAPYTLELPDPTSGVTSTVADTGELALHLQDQSSSSRMGRINRGNWSSVQGVTMHTRVRFGAGSADTMGLQINDGVANGRLGLSYTDGSLKIRTGTPDSGWPSSLPLPVNQWIELWARVAGGKYWLYTFSPSGWTLASKGIAPASGGVVYIGSLSQPGLGSMDVDFFRLKTSGALDPSDPSAPCVQPSALPSVTPVAGVVEPGSATQVAVAPSERGVYYQLQKNGTNIGTPVAGNGGTVYLSTGPVNASSEFSVRATASTGSGCSATLQQTATVLAGHPVSRIGQAKAFADGETVSLSAKPVTASTGQSYWIEEPDRSSALRVMSGTLPPIGSLRNVTGTISTVDGERRLQVISEVQAGGSNPVEALGMNNARVGGGDLNNYSPGIEGGVGLNNIGLLARVWGTLGAVQDGAFYVDDGSALIDGTDLSGAPTQGLRILGWPDEPAPGAFNRVTGPVTTFADNAGQIRPAIVQITAGCTSPATNLPVTIDNSVLCPGQTTVVRVQSSEPGVSYQLRKGTNLVNVGAPIAGNGGSIELPTGPISENTVFDVLATRNHSTCSARLTTQQSVAVSAPPAAGLHVSVSNNPIDPGGSTTFTVDFSEVGVSYQLLKQGSPVGSAVAGTSGSINLPSGPIAASSQFSIRATSSATGCYSYLTTMTTIVVNNPLSPYSKVGLHVVCGPRPGYLEFLQQCSNALHPGRVIKVVDDFSPAYEAKQVNKYTLTVGRINQVGSVDLGGLDGYVNQSPEAVAAFYYSLVKPIWQANPWIDVWEACNEWSWHWAWQADFYIALMDLAEADGFKLAIWSASVGNPPEAYYPDIARACARAAAHGGHMLSLHEYGLWADPGQHALLSNAGPDLVTRYRKLYNYLAPRNAVIPLVLTETGQDGGYNFVGTPLLIMDYTWYDQEMKKDPYVIGCAAWLLGECGWANANIAPALPALADYISTH
ncbi:MAG: hypothetical protein IT209_00275 [Armatimonadetes bacterium]|nr:hypothetical protein [Armatimonadota bacterium]